MFSERMKGPAAVLVAALLWGTTGPAQVALDPAAHPGALGAARLAVGGLLLAVVVRRWPSLAALRAAGMTRWVLVAAASTAVFQTTFLHAVDRTGAALGTVVALGCAPFATGGFAWWWLRERPDRRWLAATVTAVLGCGVILAPGQVTGVDPVGVASAVTAGCCYGAYTVAAKVFVESVLPVLAATAP